MWWAGSYGLAVIGIGGYPDSTLTRRRRLIRRRGCDRSTTNYRRRCFGDTKAGIHGDESPEWRFAESGIDRFPVTRKPRVAGWWDVDRVGWQDRPPRRLDRAGARVKAAADSVAGIDGAPSGTAIAWIDRAPPWTSVTRIDWGADSIARIDWFTRAWNPGIDKHFSVWHVFEYLS